MRGLKFASVLAFAVLAGGVPIAAQKADPSRQASVQLVPHRAIYDFSLGNVRSDKAVAGLTGRMVYEFSGSTCEGYTQTMRFLTRTTAASGTVSLTDQRTTSWEDEAGINYRFQSSQYRDQKLVEQTAGTGKRGDPGDDTRVDLTHPDKRRTAVGGAALFPIQHSIKLIEAARRGRTSFTADFFDGSESGEKTYVVTAQIGRQLAPGFNKTLPRVGHADKLDGVQAWPVMLSYFEQGSEMKDAVPAYEMGFVFMANGVSRRLVIDNGDYTMKGELSDFTLIDPLPCRK